MCPDVGCVSSVRRTVGRVPVLTHHLQLGTLKSATHPTQDIEGGQLFRVANAPLQGRSGRAGCESPDFLPSHTTPENNDVHDGVDEQHRPTQSPLKLAG